MKLFDRLSKVLGDLGLKDISMDTTLNFGRFPGKVDEYYPEYGPERPREKINMELEEKSLHENFPEYQLEIYKMQCRPKDSSKGIIDCSIEKRDNKHKLRIGYRPNLGATYREYVTYTD